MSKFRILRQATGGLRPTQVYVHEAGKTVTFSNYVAASLEVARLKRNSPESVRYTIVATKRN